MVYHALQGGFEMQRFSVLFEQDEDGIFIAHVPALPGCHTQAKTLAEAEQRVKEAIKLYLEVSRRRIPQT
jgi:predicted RNase H-like HicB family nuclease